MSDHNFWPFDEERKVAVLTTTQILRNRRPILYVSHDAEDGMWQFHDGSIVDVSAAMVSLEEMVSYDTTIAELAQLPVGWVAERESKNAAWKLRRE